MELKWFEDLIAVAEKGHFARAAETRFLTQSALSRRIKSLETWIGAELLDRTSHPIGLTPAGIEFMPTAREIVAQAYDARGRAAEHSRLSDKAVTIACLLTLALYFVPHTIANLQQQIGSFETSIVAETRTIEEYLGSLQSGAADFFVSFRHPAVQFDLDVNAFPTIALGTERIAPYTSTNRLSVDLGAASRDQIPYLEFSGTSFMSRVVESIIRKAPFSGRLRTVYRASLAESLCTGAQQGLGVAWLPESIARNARPSHPLECLDENWATEFEIVAITSASNTRPIVRRIWDTFGVSRQ